MHIRQVELDKSQMKHVPRGNSAFMAANGGEATVHFGDDESAIFYKPGVVYRCSLY